MAPRCAKPASQQPAKPTVTVRRDKVTRYRRYQHEFVTYREICDHLEELGEEYPTNFHLLPIGESKGGRDVFLVIVANNLLQPRLSTLIEAGANGSELYTVSSALHFIEHLLKTKNSLMVMDYFVIPCLNPDAYDFTVDKLKANTQRKGLKRPKKVCLQRAAKMDLSIEFPDLSRMHKPKLFDPEIMALYTVLETFKGCLRMYISLREDGRYILYPWGTSNCPPADSLDLKRVAVSGQKRGAQCLGVGSIADKKKIIKGTVVDYVKFFHGSIKFVYSVHINDKQVMEREEILKKNFEVCKIVRAMSSAVFKFYVKHRAPKVFNQIVKPV